MIANKKTFGVAAAGLALALVAATGGAWTQRAAVNWQSFDLKQAPAASVKTAEQVYKNIQILTGLPASELDGVMEFMSASLGVGCTHCHTNPWDSDAKSTKLGARRMILMTRSINKESFSGNPAITCYTCHRGQPHSVPLPPADLPASSPPAVEGLSAKPTALPPTEAIVNRYISAIGGEAAIEKMKTRVLRGTETTSNRMAAPVTMPIEIYQTSENRLLINRAATGGLSLQGFDGVRGWIGDSGGLRDMDSKELTSVKHEADFFRYLRIKGTYPQMRALGKEKVGSRAAYVVGATTREDSREKLYFDVESGLLVRQFVAFKTAFGSIPEVTDFDDYREVSGVKLPFTITWSRPPFSSTRKFTEITINVNLDNARFKPRAK